MQYPPDGELDWQGRVVRTELPPEGWIPKPGERVVVRHRRDAEAEAWIADWAGEIQWVCSIGVCPRSTQFPFLDVTLSESWPPPLSGRADGFAVSDLLPYVPDAKPAIVGPRPSWARRVERWLTGWLGKREK